MSTNEDKIKQIKENMPFLFRYFLFENYSELSNRLAIVIKPLKSDFNISSSKITLKENNIEFRFNQANKKLEVYNSNLSLSKNFLYEDNFNNVLYLIRYYKDKEIEYYLPNEFENVVLDFFNDGSQFANTRGELTMWMGVI